MTTSIPQPRTPYTQTKQRVALRLHLSDPTDRSAVDGSWWPQSRDLAVELADLVDHFPRQLGEVHRAVFSRPDWDTAPHRVRVTQGLVEVGSYPGDDSHQVWLTMSTGQLIRLSVQAPEHGPTSTPTAAAPNSHTVSEPQPWTDAGHEPNLESELESELEAEEEHWTDEGGSWWAHHRGPPSQRR